MASFFSALRSRFHACFDGDHDALPARPRVPAPDAAELPPLPSFRRALTVPVGDAPNSVRHFFGAMGLPADATATLLLTMVHPVLHPAVLHPAVWHPDADLDPIPRSPSFPPSHRVCDAAWTAGTMGSETALVAGKGRAFAQVWQAGPWDAKILRVELMGKFGEANITVELDASLPASKFPAVRTHMFAIAAVELVPDRRGDVGKMRRVVEEAGVKIDEW
ncbi:hypothetical protein DFJ74DRAFT_749203 [Hyaloraphidium curvatum]|nr:hypothetical protein DFJ74DRAFT_749203 [Hyaloraphidium curvatum]